MHNMKTPLLDIKKSQIGVTDPKTGVRSVFRTPRVAQIALLKFDQGEAVEPFRFQAKLNRMRRKTKSSS
jgi:hypothetical protein